MQVTLSCRYVELLDKYFGSVCELDIIFNFEKAYFILDELILAGEMQASKKFLIRVRVCCLHAPGLPGFLYYARFYGHFRLDTVLHNLHKSVLALG